MVLTNSQNKTQRTCLFSILWLPVWIRSNIPLCTWSQPVHGTRNFVSLSIFEPLNFIVVILRSSWSYFDEFQAYTARTLNIHPMLRDSSSCTDKEKKQRGRKTEKKSAERLRRGRTWTATLILLVLFPVAHGVHGDS